MISRYQFNIPIVCQLPPICIQIIILVKFVKFQLATTAQSVVPTTTTYGQYPHLCGTNTGYHCKNFQQINNSNFCPFFSAYIDLSETTTDTATVSITVGDATNNQWKIKVTQYSCNDPYVAAQAGCFQYHTGIICNFFSLLFAYFEKVPSCVNNSFSSLFRPDWNSSELQLCWSCSDTGNLNFMSVPSNKNFTYSRFHKICKN